jgi:dihydrofolate reductase
MRKVILNLAVSLDGFIAREDGRVDWLDNLDTDGDDLGFGTFLDRCDTILTGRIAYEVTMKLGNGEWPFSNKKTYVFTDGIYPNTNNIEFTYISPKKIVNRLKNVLGKDIWLFGGSKLISSMREENLVDEYIITTIPVMLGKGIKLFQCVDEISKLELISVEKRNSIIQTHYRVV